MGPDPNKFFETLALLGFLTPSASFPSHFDPGAGTGKLPALRAVVAGQASLVTAAHYPALFSTPPVHLLIFGGAEIVGWRTPGHTALTRRFMLLGVSSAALLLEAAPAAYTGATVVLVLSAAQRFLPFG